MATAETSTLEAAPPDTGHDAPHDAGPVTAARVPGVPPLPKSTTLLGTLLVLAADAMLLGGLLAAWFLVKGGSPSWPPEGVAIDTYFATVYSITATMSSFSAAWAVAAAKRNDQRSVGVAAIFTVVMAAAQINLLWYAISQAGFGASDHAFGTLYLLLLGYMLAHLGIALAAFVVVASRAVAGQMGPRHYDPMRAAAAIWQYTTLAWWVICIAVFVFSPHG